MEKFSVKTDCDLTSQICDCQEKIIFHLHLEEGGKIEKHYIEHEVIVTPIVGKITFTSLDDTVTLRPGEFVVLPENEPHSIFAFYPSDIMVIKVK